VLTSTTYVGCTRELLVEPLAERGLRVGEDVYVAFAPERIDPGVAGHEQLQTPRVIGAVSETCFRRAAELLRHTCKHLHRVSSPEAAEMVKLYENTFRAVNIALAFEIAEACRTHGLEPLEVTDGAASKPYGFMAHYPSAGVGGHCIGVDPHYLLHPLRERGRPARIAEEALRKLAGRPRHVVWRAHEVLVELGGAGGGARPGRRGLLQVGVADSREAPAVEIITRLRAEGAHVDYHDPLVPELALGDELLHGVDPDPRRDGGGFGPEDYDLTIVTTVHAEHDYRWLNRCPAVLDCTYRTPGGRRRFLP
jgi:UDP-N-acetyl-D-glucosamine dehydrogenase